MRLAEHLSFRFVSGARKEATPAWSVETLRALRPGIVGMGGGGVYGHTTMAMHDIEYPPPPPDRSSLGPPPAYIPYHTGDKISHPPGANLRTGFPLDRFRNAVSFWGQTPDILKYSVP